MSTPSNSVQSVNIKRFNQQGANAVPDWISVEQPLAIYVATEQQDTPELMMITMRTPGHDQFLAAGLLLSEGVIENHQQITAIESNSLSEQTDHDSELATQDSAGDGAHNHKSAHNQESDLNHESYHNQVIVSTHGIQLSSEKRRFVMNAACGLCGRSSLKALEIQCNHPIAGHFCLTEQQVQQLWLALNEQQPVFERTGGLHAAALVDNQGTIQAVYEDIGRHNAVDKLIGAHINQLPLSDYGLLVSGRVSFEIMQKAVMAGLSTVMAVGAPTTLAIDVAKRFNLTLIGFLKQHSFNVYYGTERIKTAS